MAEKSSAPELRPLLVSAVTFGLLTLLALVIGAVVVALSGKSPLLAVQELLQGAFGTRTNLGATLTRSIPVIINALAAAVAFKAGQFNLGLEGQMVTGALTGAIVANLFHDLPPIVLLPLTLIAGCLAGGLWAFFPTWLQTRFQVPLLISTLLLNYIATLFASYLVNYPLRDVSGAAAVPQTVMIPEAIRLAIIMPGTRLHAGILAPLLLALFLTWFFRRTSAGYRLRMTGLNPEFAAHGGIHTSRVILAAMAGSGAIAGLAGVIQVLGVDFRYIDGALVTAGFAWSGLITAILASANPLLIIFAGLFLAGLKVGAAGMQRNTQIPLQIADVVQAGIIFVVAVRLQALTLVKRFLFPNS